MTIERMISEIRSELSRLKADTDSHPYSGFSVEIADGLINIYDDYERSVIPEPEKIIMLFKKLKPINWANDAEEKFEPIWEAINASGGY